MYLESSVHCSLNIDVIGRRDSNEYGLRERHLGDFVVIAATQRVSEVFLNLHGVWGALYVALHEFYSLKKRSELLVGLQHQIQVKAGLHQKDQHNLIIEFP